MIKAIAKSQRKLNIHWHPRGDDFVPIRSFIVEAAIAQAPLTVVSAAETNQTEKCKTEKYDMSFSCLIFLSYIFLSGA
jgi:hypothetical protein